MKVFLALFSLLPLFTECVVLPFPPADTRDADEAFLSYSGRSVKKQAQNQQTNLLQVSSGVTDPSVAVLRREDSHLEADVSERQRDLQLMALLGTTDLGKGSVGGSLVSNLLGKSVRINSKGKYSTVFSDAESSEWKMRHSVLVEEEALARARSNSSNTTIPVAPAGNSTLTVPTLNVNGTVGAVNVTRVTPPGPWTGNAFLFNRSAVVNGTFLYNGTWYDVRDYVRSPPPLRFLLPLLRFWDAAHRDHICATDPFEFSDRQGAYDFQGIVAFIYSRIVTRDGEAEKDSDLVPLYRYWDRTGWPKQSRHFFSTNAGLRSKTLISQGIVGYIYNSPQETLVPLREMYCNATRDTLYTVSTAANMTMNGCSYGQKSIVGYVQPLDALARRKAELAAKAAANVAPAPPSTVTPAEPAVVTAPEPVVTKKKTKWHPGQPIFVSGQDWSK